MMSIRLSTVIITLVLLTACDSRMGSVERKLVDMGSAVDCDASVQACLLAHEGVEMRLELAKEIHPMQPFRLQLHVAGVQQPIETVYVEFFMEGMDMGLNRYQLLRNDGSWQGEITLPVCVAGRSYWQAVVDVSSQKSHYRGVFRFHSSK